MEMPRNTQSHTENFPYTVSQVPMKTFRLEMTFKMIQLLLLLRSRKIEVCRMQVAC